MSTLHELHLDSLKPASSVARHKESLELAVVFTSVSATLAAIKEAGELAKGLHASITLIALQVVPYPLPLSQPCVADEFVQRRFSTLASHGPVETKVRVYLCREALPTLTKLLRPGSLVIIGATRRFWPAKEKRWARELRRLGHEVVVKEI